MSGAGGIFSGRTHEGDLSLDAEVCVVGSGAGGAVVAKILAEAGLDVVVLEEGGHTPPEVYGKYRPTETLRHMAREGGTTAAFALGDTPFISLLAGRTVGGSSVFTGGVCFRIPERVTERWQRELGLPDLSQKAMESCYREVEEEIHVETVPEAMWSRSTKLWGEGAARNGHPLKPLRRNTRGCNGCGRCNFGCPHQAKLSVDLTYLRKAVQAGARIYADCRVDRVLNERGRATGVEGRLVDGPTGRARGRLRVKAATVVVCAGALHTPLLLMRSGVGKRSGVVGKRLTLHPAFRVGAVFDEEVRGWQGAMQSAYSDQFEDEGITFVSVFTPLNVVAAALPGVGPAHHARVRQLGHMAMFGGMIHDEGGGTVRRGLGREPIITYRMGAHDKERLFKGIRVAAEAFFAAGAKEVLVPIFGLEGLKSPDELRKLDAREIPGRMAECAAFHPLGSARMGTDARHAVVAPSGESFELPGLFVADGSLFPTSIGVNSQLPIMTMATRIARLIRERTGGPSSGGPRTIAEALR